MSSTFDQIAASFALCSTVSYDAFWRGVLAAYYLLFCKSEGFPLPFCFGFAR